MQNDNIYIYIKITVYKSEKHNIHKNIPFEQKVAHEAVLV